MVETARDIAANFDVLDLIFAHRYGVAVVGQYVGCLQDGVGKQARVGRQPLGFLILVGVAALQQPHRRARQQNPTQLAHLGDVGLNEQGGFIGIEPQG